MEDKMHRREFLEISAAAATAGMTLPIRERAAAAGPEDKPARIGMVGLGGRGRSLLETLLALQGVEVAALCDVSAGALQSAQGILEKAGRAKAETYQDGPEDYKRLSSREDLDAVIIATPWNLHATMAVCAMKSGKYAAVEVPAALTFEECWDLVRTSEATGKPCMMLENWSFRRDNLAVLNMIRRGLLGEIIHCHCAHSHDCIDHWFFDKSGAIRWGGEFLLKRNADQYPTHSLGPVLSWMDINCGDTYDYLTATATRSAGINAYFARKFGPDHPGAERQYAQGDIVTSVIKTKKGNTIVVNYDMQLPRPYDNRWMIQGTLGLYDESKKSVYLEGKSPKCHEWEPFEPYQQEHEHRWWKEMLEAKINAGHEGTDYLELREFVQAVRQKTQPPIDVYDSVMMSVITPLSEKSIASGSAPVECPDFTRGAWKTRKPRFALDP